MPNKLDQLRAMTTVVADTGDMDSIRAFKPTDSTTNPSLILKAAQLPAYARSRRRSGRLGPQGRGAVGAVTERLAIDFGAELTRIVPGRVSTEVDADLSFDVAGTIAKAKCAHRRLRGARHRARAHSRSRSPRPGRARRPRERCSARVSIAI